MKAELFALLTAVMWAVGSYFGKKGMHDANLDPKIGLTIRLVVSALIILVIAIPLYGQIGSALGTPQGKKGVLQILVFEGIVAGLVGMLLYYTALKQGELSRIMPIAFTSPLFGYILGVSWGGEPLTFMKTLGGVLALVGILILTAF